MFNFKIQLFGFESIRCLAECLVPNTDQKVRGFHSKLVPVDIGQISFGFHMPDSSQVYHSGSGGAAEKSTATFNNAIHSDSVQ